MEIKPIEPNSICNVHFQEWSSGNQMQKLFPLSSSERVDHLETLAYALTQRHRVSEAQRI